MAIDRIERIALWLIDSPIRSARSHGSGHVKRSVRRVILAIHTADGLVGWGEAAPWAPFGNTAETALAALRHVLVPALTGQDATRIVACMATCAGAIAGHADAKAALEMALWDIAGKRLGAPVSALFGGLVRAAIPLSFSIADPDFTSDLDRARDMHAQGHRIFKVKTGFLDPAEDMRRLDALRAALPGMDLRVDYNQGLAPHEALPVLREVERVAPTFIEQPVPRGQEASLARLAAALDTPVLADESVTSPEEMLRAVREGFADAVSIKLMKSGGLLAARAIDAIAAAAGVPSYGGTLWEGGIALAAAAHLLGTLPNCTLGCEFYMPSYALVRDIVPDVLLAGGGMVQVPGGPGLGVSVDMELLAGQALESL